MPNALFLVPVRISRGPNSEMPPNLIGAIVECFVAAPDHLSAVTLAAAKINEKGDRFEDLLDGKVHQLDPAAWPGYLARKYPELADRLPPQPEMTQFMKMGGVFFGPFLGFEQENKPPSRPS